MKTCTRFLSVIEPRKTDADGLIKCLGKALQSMGIENILERENVLHVSHYPVLVGCGTDGASDNISRMRSKLQAVSSWLFWA